MSSVVSLLRLIFWAAVLILALSYFGISIRAILSSPTGQENVAYIYNLLSELWNWATFWIRP